MDIFIWMAEGYDSWMKISPTQAKVPPSPSVLPLEPIRTASSPAGERPVGKLEGCFCIVLSLTLPTTRLAAFISAGRFESGNFSTAASLRQVVTAVTFNVASDLIAQSISRSRTDPELRTWEILPPIRLAFWGLLCTPVVDQWYVGAATPALPPINHPMIKISRCSSDTHWRAACPSSTTPDSSQHAGYNSSIPPLGQSLTC